MNEEQFLALCSIDNDYANNWNDKLKLDTFVTKVKE
jgi:hypothetical protein